MSDAATDQPFGTLETVATFDGPMPTGVTVSHSGRMFVSFPKWGDDVKATVAEVCDGECVPFPHQASNSPSDHHDADAFVSVQSVVVDPFDRLWVLDTGSPEFRRTEVGGPKLVCVDLSTDTVIQTIVPPREVALEATYLNDIRFDLRRGEAGMAFITDSSDGGANGIIVVDLASGDSWRWTSMPSSNSTSSTSSPSACRLLVVSPSAIPATLPKSLPSPGHLTALRKCRPCSPGSSRHTRSSSPRCATPSLAPRPTAMTAPTTC